MTTSSDKVGLENDTPNQSLENPNSYSALSMKESKEITPAKTVGKDSPPSNLKKNPKRQAPAAYLSRDGEVKRLCHSSKPVLSRVTDSACDVGTTNLLYTTSTPVSSSNIDEATQLNGPSTSCTVSDMDSESDLPLTNLADINVITSRIPWIKLEIIPSSSFKKIAAFILHKYSDSKQFLSLSDAMKEDILKLLPMGTSLTREEKSVSKELDFDPKQVEF